MQWRWRETILLVTLRALICVNQFMGMAPIVRVNDTSLSLPRYRAAPPVRSACDVALWLALTCGSPFFLTTVLEVFQQLSVVPDDLFHLIAQATFACDLILSLLVVAVQKWQRHHVVQFLNFYSELLEDFVGSPAAGGFASWHLLLVLALKIGLMTYDVVTQMFFLFLARVTLWQFVASFCTIYIQQMRCVFCLDVYVTIMVLNACYRQMQADLEQGRGGAAKQLQRMMACHYLVTVSFRSTFQLSVCLLVIGLLIDFFGNLYALIYYLIMTYGLWYTFITYSVSIAIELYTLIWVSHLCCCSQRRVRDSLLERMDACEPIMPWMENIHFRVLGLFSLGHEFWMFLVTYAVNFIVIILQFGVKNNKLHQRKINVYSE